MLVKKLPLESSKMITTKTGKRIPRIQSLILNEYMFLAENPLFFSYLLKFEKKENEILPPIDDRRIPECLLKKLVEGKELPGDQ